MNKITLLTGAGVSAESGIPVFRGEDGLWTNSDFEKYARYDAWKKYPEKVREFYDMRRSSLADCQPNPAHKGIADLIGQLGDRITLFTQNVDDLFERSGIPSEKVKHLHGTLTDLRCDICGHIWNIGYRSQLDKDTCPLCNTSRVRHNVVMFGEPVPEYTRLYDWMAESDMLVVIGTSGRVIDVRWIAMNIRYSILNNLDPEPHMDHFFDHVIYKPATEAITEITSIINQKCIEYETSK